MVLLLCFQRLIISVTPVRRRAVHKDDLAMGAIYFLTGWTKISRRSAESDGTPLGPMLQRKFPHFFWHTQNAAQEEQATRRGPAHRRTPAAGNP